VVAVLKPGRAEHPDVPGGSAPGRGDLAAVPTDASRSVRLTVVGAHRRPGRSRSAWAPVIHGLFAHAECPIAAVQAVWRSSPTLGAAGAPPCRSASVPQRLRASVHERPSVSVHGHDGHGGVRVAEQAVDDGTDAE
jgi:hypothetical protein